MAVEGHLHKIVAGGKLCETESWSISMHYLTSNPEPLVIAGDMANAFNAWFTGGAVYLHPNASLDFIKANELDPAARANLPDPKTGLPRPISKPFTRYLSTGGVNELWLSPGTATAVGGAKLPPQCTTAVSLTTGLVRGAAHMGRVYPPGSYTVEADGRLSVIAAQGMALSFAQLVADINGSNVPTSGPALGGICIYSGLEGGVTHKVTGVRVGRVVDTQRRRRRSLVEDYQLHGLEGF